MSKKYIFLFCIFIIPLTSISQVSELHLDDLFNCIPSKHKDAVVSIEQQYKDGVALFNDSQSSTLTDQQKIEKLASLFVIQVSTKSKLNEIWEQSDSAAKQNSSKYFTEASIAFKTLTDTINTITPNFKSFQSALVAVEKAHQVIILQKFGLQVLLGCVSDGGAKLGQPTDIPNIVVNIDMIERFRKAWNEANAPMTYDKWVYKPSERKMFSANALADSYKDRFNPKKKEDLQDLSKQDLTSQNALALTSGDSNTSLTSTADGGKTTSSSNLTGVRSGGKNNKTNSTNNGITGFVPSSTSKNGIKGDANRYGFDPNTQFEIKNLVTQSTIKSLGADYFSIQIAASKNKLIVEKLANEHNCINLSIDERSEDGWYKYLIGHFTSFDSAVEYLAKPCVTRGFISGYSNKNGRLAILSIKRQMLGTFDTTNYSIVYRVQIAASKQPLSNETIATLYKGFNPINVVQENGWYKYSIGDYIYFNEAKITKDSCGTKDAFIMPYHNQKRISWPKKEVMEALKYKQNENAIYVVQVAASKKPIPTQMISDIIKIDYPLTMKFEDGWYKYYISAFTNFAVAKEVAAKLGIKGAFIATYKNGLRIKP